MCEELYARVFVASVGDDALFVSMSEVTDERSERTERALLLTIVEAARVLSIGRTTMYELVAAGEIDVVHIGRSARVPVAALDSFVERRRREGATVLPSRRAARAGREPGPGQPTT